VKIGAVSGQAQQSGIIIMIVPLAGCSNCCICDMYWEVCPDVKFGSVSCEAHGVVQFNHKPQSFTAPWAFEKPNLQAEV
jgi:hypothetical protein